MNDLFHYVLLALWLSDRKSEIKKNCDNVQWNVWTNIKILYTWNKIFKKEFQIWDFESFLHFGPNFVFRGSASECFIQCVFLIFCYQPTKVVDIFTQPAHHKKASYSPVIYMFLASNCMVQENSHIDKTINTNYICCYKTKRHKLHFKEILFLPESMKTYF